jgi:GGDEF domain-containing protein
LTFDRARSILLFSGVGLMGIVALGALAVGVDRVEVAATLLFIPVFAGFLFFGMKGGLVMAAAASIAYLALRFPAIRLVGFSATIGQILVRVFGYLGFAAGGAWAASQVKGSLEKIENREDVDKATGLGNARSMIEAVDLERSRADRDKTTFSLVAADFMTPTWESLPARKQQALLTDLVAKLVSGLRGADHAVHARKGEHHVIGIVLPETTADGARVVADNFKGQLGRAEAVTEPRVAMATYPTEESAVVAILELFWDIYQTEGSEAV